MSDWDWLLEPEALDLPWRVLMEAGITLEATGDLRLAASAYDLAYGAAPDERRVIECRHRVLQRLAVVEHGLRFCYVPAGPFTMGNDEGDDDERPAHRVVLDGFWITDIPITWASYCRLLGWSDAPDATPPEEELKTLSRDAQFSLYEGHKIRMQYCETGTLAASDWHAHAGTMPGLFSEPERDPEAGDDDWNEKPMVAVCWDDGEALGERLSTPDVHVWLPSEAEWEKAARGGLRGALYPWGDALPTSDRCDNRRFGEASMLVPRALTPNGYGLHGMVGGVWEWTHDWYDARAYEHATVRNPEGPPTGTQKVLRGGSWADVDGVCTVSFRMGRAPTSWRTQTWGEHQTPNVGFRLVRHDTRAHGVERP